MFEKSLADLIRGLRSHKKNEEGYISGCLQEIREELKSPDVQKKAVAIQKLTYLEIYGYDMSWAAFNVIEVMSSTRFGHKRIGYLAASQSYSETTDVITLATQLIRRDMTGASIFDAGVAINCLGNICTLDLARDLAADVVSLLNSSKPYVRKKAVLVLYKIFLKFPDALRPAFPRLKEKLEDSDPGVVSAAVNVICELARKNPKNYIALAPTLFKILTTSTNNWMLIKLVKLFGALLPIEPRLSKKLATPLTNILNTTPAMSLLYETIQTCTIGLQEHEAVIRLCISKLRTFVEDADPNLKYLGLLALNNIMKINPKAVAEHRDLVVACLDDEDTTLRLRALDLLEGMVTKRNISDVVRKLLDHVEKADGGYKDVLVEKVINICSKNTYANIGTDFEWYISVLVELAHVKGTKHGDLIANQLMDVIIRVKIVRPFGVKSTVALIRATPTFVDSLQQGGNCEVLYAAAYVTGEFAENIEDPVGAIAALLQSGTLSLPPHIQGIYLQAALKVFSRVIGDEDTAPQVVSDVIKILESRLPVFAQSQNLEVQERACLLQEMQRLYTEMDQAGTPIGAYVASLFDEPLNPVAPKAQKKVPVPDGLNLDEPINEPDSDDEDKPEYGGLGFDVNKYSEGMDWGSDREKANNSATDEDRRDHHSSRDLSRSGSSGHVGGGGRTTSSAALVNNPYMLKQESPSHRKSSTSEEEVPSITLEKGELGPIDPLADFKKTVERGPRASSSRDQRGRRSKSSHIEVMRDMDMPEGATESDDEGPASKDDVFGSIDLTTPLRADEVLPSQQHRIVASGKSAGKSDRGDKRSSSSRSEKEKDKDKDRSKDRHSSSRHGSHSSSHRSKDSKDSKDAKDSKDSKSKSSSGSKGGGSLIDLDTAFDEVASAPATPTASSGFTGSLTPPTQGSSRSGADKDRRHGSSRDDKERSGGGHGSSSSSRHHSSSSKSADSKSRSSRPSRSDDKHHGSSSGHGDGPKPPPKFKTFLQDDNLTVMYELRTNPKESKKIMAAFQLRNTAKEPLSSIEFAFSDTLNLRVAPVSVLKPTFTIAPGESATHNIIFEVQSFKTSQKATGSASYQLASGASSKRDGQVVLPSSAFVMPVKLEKEAYVQLLREQSSSLSMSSVVIPTHGDFRALVVALAHLLHVELILMERAASLYGKTIQGHHVAVYAVPPAGSHSDGQVQVDLKCSDGELAESLVKEVTSYFH